MVAAGLAGWSTLLLVGGSHQARQNLKVIGQVLPLVRWDELVVTEPRFHHLLEFPDLEMNQPPEGRIHRVWGIHAGVKLQEAVGERGRDFERHPGAAFQEGAHVAALLHGSSEGKKTARGGESGGYFHLASRDYTYPLGGGGYGSIRRRMRQPQAVLDGISMTTPPGRVHAVWPRSW